LQEGAEWCEAERPKKPGDMTLKCLKLFLDGAGENIRQKNGIEINPNFSQKETNLV